MRTWTQWVTRAVVVGLTLVPTVGRGEEAPEARRTLLLAQPLYGSVGQLAFSVEHAVGSHVALSGAVQGSVSFDESGFLDDTAGFAFRRWSVGVDPGVHFYFAGRAPEGFWVGPHAELSVSHVASSEKSATLDGPMTTTGGWRTLMFGGSARVGYTTTLSPGLSLQVAAGLFVLRGHTTNFTPARDGLDLAPVELARRDWYVGPRMTLGVGWAL